MLTTLQELNKRLLDASRVSPNAKPAETAVTRVTLDWIRGAVQEAAEQAIAGRLAYVVDYGLGGHFPALGITVTSSMAHPLIEARKSAPQAVLPKNADGSVMKMEGVGVSGAPHALTDQEIAELRQLVARDLGSLFSGPGQKVHVRVAITDRVTPPTLELTVEVGEKHPSLATLKALRENAAVVDPPSVASIAIGMRLTDRFNAAVTKKLGELESELRRSADPAATIASWGGGLSIQESVCLGSDVAVFDKLTPSQRAATIAAGFAQARQAMEKAGYTRVRITADLLDPRQGLHVTVQASAPVTAP